MQHDIPMLFFSAFPALQRAVAVVDKKIIAPATLQMSSIFK